MEAKPNLTLLLKHDSVVSGISTFKTGILNEAIQVAFGIIISIINNKINCNK